MITNCPREVLTGFGREQDFVLNKEDAKMNAKVLMLEVSYSDMLVMPLEIIPYLDKIRFAKEDYNAKTITFSEKLVEPKIVSLDKILPIGESDSLKQARLKAIRDKLQKELEAIESEIL
jgi:hypothetical protein